MAMLQKFKLQEWSDYAKWATEGAFEFVRQNEFPDSCSRMKSNYFYDDLPNCKKLYAYDWGEESIEEQQKVHLFAVEVADPTPQRRDMRVYDEAYEAMASKQDIQLVLNCARRYFPDSIRKNLFGRFSVINRPKQSRILPAICENSMEIDRHWNDKTILSEVLSPTM